MASFHNYSHRILLSELNFDLPCPDTIWDATSSNSCKDLLAIDGFERPTLDKILLFLGQDNWSARTESIMRKLSCRSLFTIIYGTLGILCSFIPRSQADFLPGLHALIRLVGSDEPGVMTTVQIRRSLHRWKEMWDVQESTLDDQSRENLGITQYSLEFWWMAMLLMEVEATRSAHIIACLPIEEEAEDTSQIHETLRRFENLSF
jgi:hypothetical protein